MTIKITNDELRKLAKRFGWQLGTGTDNGVEVDVLWLRPLEYGVTASELSGWFGDFLAEMIGLGKVPKIEVQWMVQISPDGKIESPAMTDDFIVGWHGCDKHLNFIPKDQIMPGLVRSAIDMFESEGWKND